MLASGSPEEFSSDACFSPLTKTGQSERSKRARVKFVSDSLEGTERVNATLKSDLTVVKIQKSVTKSAITNGIEIHRDIESLERETRDVMREGYGVEALENQPAKVTILRQEEGLLFINKAAGVLSVPGSPTSDLNSLGQRVPVLREELQLLGYPETYIVHRLDRETSGVMVVALDKAMHQQVSQQFLERKVKKTYLAWTQGVPPLPIFECKDPVDGKSSHTKFRVLKKFSFSCVLEAAPLTGRRHQIRQHLRNMGYPIIGDPIYGERLNTTVPMGLHASELTVFNFPTVKAPLPEGWKTIAHYLGETPFDN